MDPNTQRSMCPVAASLLTIVPIFIVKLSLDHKYSLVAHVAMVMDLGAGRKRDCTNKTNTWCLFASGCCCWRGASFFGLFLSFLRRGCIR